MSFDGVVVVECLAQQYLRIGTGEGISESLAGTATVGTHVCCRLQLVRMPREVYI